MARVVVSVVLACVAACAAGATPAVAARDLAMKADEAAPPPAVARFLMGTRLGLITCSGTYRTYLEKQDLYQLVSDDGIATPRRLQPPSRDETAACVDETLAKGRGLQAAAARHAAAEPAKTALREYATAWEASLRSLESQEPEAPRAFDARLKKQEARLDELQRRVEATTR